MGRAGGCGLHAGRSAGKRRSSRTLASVGRREHRRGRQRVHPEPAPAPAWSNGGRLRGNGRRSGASRRDDLGFLARRRRGRAISVGAVQPEPAPRRARRRRCRRDRDRMVARPRPDRLDRPPPRRDRRWRRGRARDRPCPRAVPRQGEQRAVDRADRAHPSLSGRRRGGSDRPRRARGIVATRAAAGDPRRHAPVPVARGNAQCVRRLDQGSATAGPLLPSAAAVRLRQRPRPPSGRRRRAARAGLQDPRVRRTTGSLRSQGPGASGRVRRRDAARR